MYFYQSVPAVASKTLAQWQLHFLSHRMYDYVAENRNRQGKQKRQLFLSNQTKKEEEEEEEEDDARYQVHFHPNARYQPRRSAITTANPAYFSANPVHQLHLYTIITC
ncbi:hypothetical protein ACJX0J_025658 [Zea mays]